MGDIALALCGGGGKGAFQIGVWKSLEEHGIMKKVKAIAGASVGALNAVLFALGDFKMAKHIWYRINNDVLLSLNPRLGSGLFSRKGLERILREVQLKRIYDCGMDVYVALKNLDEGVIEYKHLNSLSVDEMIKALLASSALPVAYAPVELQGKINMDPGTNEYGNTPIEPLYRQGFRDIYVLSLNHEFSEYSVRKGIRDGLEVINLHQAFPGCDITAIQPLKDLGATLDFSQTSIRSRMIQGYADANTSLNKGEAYHMARNYSGINNDIRNKMKAMFKNGSEFKEFVTTMDIGLPNPKCGTGGGTRWYKDIFEIDGWRVQWHTAPLSILKSHYRIIDGDNVRWAYTFNPDVILKALTEYESILKFNDD